MNITSKSKSNCNNPRLWADKLLILGEWLLLKPTETEQHDILVLLRARRKTSSTIFCSQYHDSGWYDQLGGDDSPLAEATLDRIMHDAYKINIIPADPENYRSMREVYGLDESLSECFDWDRYSATGACPCGPAVPRPPEYSSRQFRYFTYSHRKQKTTFASKKHASDSQV